MTEIHKAANCAALQVSLIYHLSDVCWWACSLGFTQSGEHAPQFSGLTKLPIVAKANWHSLTQTGTITIDRLLSSHLKNMLLMGDMKSLSVGCKSSIVGWGGGNYTTQAFTGESYLAIWPWPGPLLLISFGSIHYLAAELSVNATAHCLVG